MPLNVPFVKNVEKVLGLGGISFGEYCLHSSRILDICEFHLYSL